MHINKKKKKKHLPTRTESWVGYKAKVGETIAKSRAKIAKTPIKALEENEETDIFSSN
jgi:hypothetical protein